MKMIEIRRSYDENNWDTLIGRRLEIFFEANLDGSPSVNGHAIFHCEWEHRTNSVLRATSIGPQVRFPLASVLGGTFAGVAGPDLVMAIKDAFIQYAGGLGELVEVDVPDPLPAPGDEPEPEPEPGDEPGDEPEPEPGDEPGDEPEPEPGVE